MPRPASLLLPLGGLLCASLIAWSASGDEVAGAAVGDHSAEEDAGRPEGSSGPTALGDKALGDKASGDKSSGDKASGDKASGDKSPAALPAFTVTPRVPVMEGAGVYPCSDCHDASMPADPTVRPLVDEHDTIKLQHGGQRFWCLTCHDAANRDQLTGLDGRKISFNQSHLLCGQCHYRVERDFAHGAHGLRLNSWQGQRVLAPCTRCHDAHSPSIKPRKPLPPDVLREGLQDRGWSDQHRLPHQASPAPQLPEGAAPAPSEGTRHE